MSVNDLDKVVVKQVREKAQVEYSWSHTQMVWFKVTNSVFHSINIRKKVVAQEA